MWNHLKRSSSLVWDVLSLIGWALLLVIVVRRKDVEDREEYD